MDFREEYKKSEKLISPTDEQLQKMMSAVMSRIESGEEDTKELNITPAKKAFPYKKIAFIGGSVAACAAITIAAVNIAPTLNNVPTAERAGSLSASADDARQNTALTTNAATTYSADADKLDAESATEFDTSADSLEDCAEETAPESFVMPLVPESSKSNGYSANDNLTDNSLSAKDCFTAECEAAEVFETLEISESEVDEVILTEEPDVDNATDSTKEPIDDAHKNPETGADPDLIAAWSQAVEDSPLVCIEDFDCSFEKPLTKLEFTSADSENDTLIIGDKTYKLTNHEEEDEWSFTWFSMSNEEIAALPYEYFTTGHFNEFQHIYKIFFAEDRCFVVYLLGDAASFANPQGEYVLVG
ncbi:MAG: hypothetical protein ACI4KM_02855 [Oscillospiraceae bacterium]